MTLRLKKIEINPHSRNNQHIKGTSEETNFVLINLKRNRKIKPNN